MNNNIIFNFQSTHFQSTDSYMQAAQIAALNQKQQLEDAEKSKQSENILLVFRLSGEMFGLIKEREMEKKLLDSINEILKIEITQLERQYAAELDTSQMIKSTVEMVVAKIQDIELTFQRCKNQYPEHYHSDKVSEFAILREKVTKLASVEVKEAPKLETSQKDGSIMLLEEKAIFPFSNTLILGNIDPLLKNEIEVLAKKYEVLENDVSPLRLENQILIHQKQRIVEIHKGNLKKGDQDSPIKKMLKEVEATNSNLVWEQLTKVNQGAFPTSEFSPTGIKYATDDYNKRLSEYITLAKIQMVSLISTLKTKTEEEKS